MIICPKCKKQIYDDAEKCVYCGYSLTEDADYNDDFVPPPIPVGADNQSSQRYQSTINYNACVNPVVSNKAKQKNKNLIIAFAIVSAMLIAVTAFMCIFTERLIINILIALASSIVPIITGIIFNAVGNAGRSSKSVSRFLHIYGSIFSCICPFILLLVIYYAPAQMPVKLDASALRIASVIITLTVCFIGYMPAHYNSAYSLNKNNILGVINILRNIFIWSFISCEVAVYDGLVPVQQKAQSSFSFSEYLPFLLKVGIILALLQALKLIAEEFEDVKI